MSTNFRGEKFQKRSETTNWLHTVEGFWSRLTIALFGWFPVAADVDVFGVTKDDPRKAQSFQQSSRGGVIT